MNLKTIAPALLLMAVIAAPAHANWFDNFMAGENHKKILGAATTPTPDDLRAIGDSAFGEGKTYHFDPKSGHWREVRPSRDDKLPPQGASGPAPGPANTGADAPPQSGK
jgi:hypothetical protein